MKLLLFVATLLLLPELSSACYVPPSSYSISAAKAVEQAEFIVLARLLRTERTDLPQFCREPMPDEAEHSVDARISYGEKWRKLCHRTQREVFAVLEVLKGEPRQLLRLDLPERRTSTEVSFSDHRAEEFQPPWGRVGVDGDCGLYPSFEVGRTYLLLGPTPHPLNFERIDNAELDVWLATVRHTLSEPSATQQGVEPD